MPGLAGAVLCGGASTRMGTDKAELVVDGERLVERAARRLATVADPVLIASGRGQRIGGLAPEWLQVDDVVDDAGPLAGIAATLTASPQPLVAVVAVDLVQLDAALLAWLASLWREGDAAVVPRDEDGRIQPLHAVYATFAGPAFVAAVRAARFSVQDAVDALPVREVGIDEWGTRFAPGWSRNANRPESL